MQMRSAPAPLAFCFSAIDPLLDAMARAVRRLQVRLSALGKIGNCFFLVVAVRLSQRISARCLFWEYGVYLGCGWLLLACLRERADWFSTGVLQSRA